MVPPAARRSTLACALLVSGAFASAELGKHITDTLVDGADKATIGQLIAEGGGLSTELCGGPDDAFKAKHVEVTPNALVAIVHGALARPLSGGTVSAKLMLQKPGNLTIGQHFKYVAATAFTRARQFSEPLCKHLGLSTAASGESCTVPAGQQELRLGFQKLPEMVFAGKYDLEIRVEDEAGAPVTCVRGGMTVKPGKSNSIMRKLEDGCPWFIMDHIWAIEKININDDCDGPERKMDANFEMKGSPGFWMQGHWYGYCDNQEDKMFRMWKRKDGLWGECQMETSESGPCDWLQCNGVMCDDYNRCVPTHEETHPGHDYEWCQSDDHEFHMDPYSLPANCYEGAPVSVSASQRHSLLSTASAAMLLVGSPVLLLLRI